MNLNVIHYVCQSHDNFSINQLYIIFTTRGNPLVGIPRRPIGYRISNTHLNWSSPAKRLTRIPTLNSICY